jgi:uncharacterized protein YprB with RNaseH-like and TPR domain
MLFYSDWGDGHQAMLESVHALLSEADAVVTYNGDRFDLPKLHGEFLVAGLPPPPPLTSIDVYKTMKKLGFLSNKLAFIGPLLTGEGKVKHEGHELWTRVMAGDPKAQAKMQRYCSQDVRLLEQVYDRCRPYIRNHPHMAMTPALPVARVDPFRAEPRASGGPRRCSSSGISASGAVRGAMESG